MFLVWCYNICCLYLYNIIAIAIFLFFYRLGMFFCPLLPFVGLLKDIVLFYMRSWAVRVFNNAPKHLYRAEATINYYFGLLLLLVIAIMFPVGWTVTRYYCVVASICIDGSNLYSTTCFVNFLYGYNNDDLYLSAYCASFLWMGQV